MKIPGYKLVEEISSAGAATVYLGVQLSLNRKVAIKVLNQFDNPSMSQRFLEEGHTIAGLNHRNIVTIYNVGRVKKYHYIAMEFLERGSLATKIKRGMSVNSILNVMESIGGCLEYAHKRGIVHRDVKPTNILIHKDGTPKLTDFGIAKNIERDQEITLDGSALGSPYYLSPEQSQGKTVDSRSDLYSLGIVFYEMLTGQKAYVEDSDIQTIIAHINKPVPELPKKFARYQTLLNNLLAKSPDDRFNTAGEMVGYIRGLRMSSNQNDESIWSSTIEWFLNQYHAIPGRYRIAILGLVIFVASGISFFGDAENGDSLPKLAKVNMTDSSDNALQENISYNEADASVNESGLDHDQGSEIKQSTSTLSQIDQEKRQRLLQTFLDRATKSTNSYRLTQPKNDNALYYYLKAAKINPKHPEVRRGILNILDIYASLTRKEMNRGNYQAAQVYLARGKSIKADYVDYAALDFELQNFITQQKNDPNFQAYDETQDAVTIVALNEELNSPIVEQREINPVPKSWNELWHSIVGPYGAEDTVGNKKRSQIQDALR